MMRDIRLLDAAFSPAELVQGFTAANQGAGGVASFTGLVRGEGGIQALELSHYEPMTLAGMEALADRAEARFDLLGLMMAHRVGHMKVGEAIVCVAAAAHHRRDAIDAVDFAMDHLKSQAWFWKREKRADGWHWIEPRGQDHTDIARWNSAE